MTALVIMSGYLVLLLVIGLVSNRFLRGTAMDYFVASHSMGPFLLLMSIFGTAMTAFALVGSSSEAYRTGIVVYGTLASWSGLVHVAVFFFVGMRLWAIGKRHGYVTQIQYFRERYESDFLGLLLFPILVGLVIPYLVTALLGANGVTLSLTRGTFPGLFPATQGGVPPWLTGLVLCGVVLFYIFCGGLRAAAWANALQTLIFLVTGLIAFGAISAELGGMAAASRKVLEAHPEHLIREGMISPLDFLTYGLIPLSIGAFPHAFQHWLTAKSAKTFRLTIIAHPVFILVVWAPSVLVGLWATSATLPDGSLVVPPGSPPNTELATMVDKLTAPLLGGLIGAGILTAIMSSLDSQFFCLGTMFTKDIVVHYFKKDRVSDQQQVHLARVFIVVIVGVSYLLSLAQPRGIFTLGVWCFTGFTSLFPLVVLSIYWRRATKAGAIASVIVAAMVWLLLFRDGGYGANADYKFLGLMPVAINFAASLLTMVIVSLLTRAPSQETLLKYFWPNTPLRAPVREGLAADQVRG
jgi:SSS family solute:Na+ symporter